MIKISALPQWSTSFPFFIAFLVLSSLLGCWKADGPLRNRIKMKLLFLGHFSMSCFLSDSGSISHFICMIGLIAGFVVSLLICLVTEKMPKTSGKRKVIRCILSYVVLFLSALFVIEIWNVSLSYKAHFFLSYSLILKMEDLKWNVSKVWHSDWPFL